MCQLSGIALLSSALSAASARLEDAGIAGIRLLSTRASAGLLGRELFMAEVVVTFKLMPESPSVDYDFIKGESVKILSRAGRVEKEEFVPIAFGLKSLMLYAVFPESIGGEVDSLAEKVGMIAGVENCQVVDVRRAIDLG